jgi:hypothetical protein
MYAIDPTIGQSKDKRRLGVNRHNWYMFAIVKHSLMDETFMQRYAELASLQSMQRSNAHCTITLLSYGAAMLPGCSKEEVEEVITDD